MTESKDIFDFNPSLDANTYYARLKMFLEWKNHYKTGEPYTYLLDNFITKVKERGNSTEKAINNIKYYVKLFKECGGSSEAFWKKLLPSATINDDNQIINPKRNAHFPNYLRRRPFMSLIEKVVRLSYAQQIASAKAQTTDVLNAGEKKPADAKKVSSASPNLSVPKDTEGESEEDYFAEPYTDENGTVWKDWKPADEAKPKGTVWSNTPFE